MSDFQIIGIRPLDSCHQKFRKILNSEQLYLFDDRFNIHYNDKNEIVDIAFSVEKDIVPRNLYSKGLDIHINALIGGNGSGKSALAELFLYFMFYYGIQKGHIPKQQSQSDIDNDEFGMFSQVKYTQELRMMDVYLNVELVYISDHNLYQIILKNGNFLIKVDDHYLNQPKFDKQIPFEDFVFPFYSMYVNYSHHGLNTNIEGEWLRTLFHKNDGYQLPVVINPYRVKGNIDINVENYLSRDRVFTNVIDTADKTLILPHLEIDFIEIAVDSSKSIEDFASYEKRSEAMVRLVEPLYKFFFKVDDYINSLDYYKSNVEKYLLGKIKTITERYVDYKKYNRLVNQIITGSIVDEDEVKLFFQQLYQDRSHVTLKIRQSLNFLRHDIYKIDKDKGSKHFRINEITKSIDELRKDKFFTETIDYLPPPIFMTRFHFNNKSHFDQLSSGEKQQIYSIHSIIYHLKNIDSVHESVGSKLKYNSVFLVLDEIELYYHPQAQKKTIDRLLYFLEKSKLRYVKYLNIMFLTHSPFILSDIPSEFTLKLKEGKIFSSQEKHKTFAANITDLLTDSFFLENGLMGDFAKEKINKTIDWLRDEKNFQNSEYHRKIIQIIDEPIVQQKLSEMYSEKMKVDFSEEILSQQIESLKQKYKNQTGNDYDSL